MGTAQQSEVRVISIVFEANQALAPSSASTYRDCQE
jgi:hypothetical protein